MVKNKEDKLKEKRKFKKGTSMARLEDRITELEILVEELQNV